ncbi:hypothetical protein PCANC_25060, partial [Puccinia coronata f. sp. avenae]
MATVLLFMVYLPSGMLYRYLLNWISLPNLVGLMTTSLTSISAPVVYFYCATLHGPFCPPDGDVNLVQGQISQIAQSVTGTARVASDVLDSVIQLSEPGHLALHQTEIIELPYAILWSSELPEKDRLSNNLNELSTLSGELRNKLYGLNRQGLNSFSSISHEFLRLQDLLYWVQTGDKKYTFETIADNLEILVFHLSTELTQLVNTIENLIPLAHRSADLGTRVLKRLHHEHFNLIREKNRRGLWRKLADLTSYSGQQLSHDLSLNSESIKSLKETWMQLEQIRVDLVTYRDNISNFKASFIGWHMADHHLTPEDELFSLRKVIENFQTTINQIKSSSRLR